MDRWTDRQTDKLIDTLKKYRIPHVLYIYMDLFLVQNLKNSVGQKHHLSHSKMAIFGYAVAHSQTTPRFVWYVGLIDALQGQGFDII